jgi:hypothetical protein
MKEGSEAFNVMNIIPGNQYCGSASFECRPGFDFPFWYRSGSGLASKQCWSTFGSYPKLYPGYISLKIRQITFTFIHRKASSQCFSLLISGKCVTNFRHHLWNFREKRGKNMCLELKPIRIGMPWMPIWTWQKWCGSGPIRIPDPQHWS